MKRVISILSFLVVSIGSMSCGGEWKDVERILQRTGERHDGSLILRYPRTDLKVKMEEVELDPAMGMTSTFRFLRKGRGARGATLNGEIVLLPQEVVPVVKKLVAEGLSISALHSTSYGIATDLFSVHFTGEGDPEALVWAFTPALSATGTPTGPPKEVVTSVRTDWNGVEKILGAGKKTGKAFLIRIPRKELIKRYPEVRLEAESEVVFQEIGSRTAVFGRFPVLQKEIYPVSKTLIDSGICVRGIHSHSLHGSPRLLFLDLWGVSDDREKLAHGVKRAIESLAAVAGRQE